MKISYNSAQKKLAVSWFLSSFAFFAIILAQTLFGKLDGNIQEAWSWAMSSVIPSLSLMLTVFLANLNNNKDHQVDYFYYKLALGVTFGYFSILLAHILVQPFTGKKELDIINQSKIYIGSIQGVVSSCLGMFFVKKETKTS